MWLQAARARQEKNCRCNKPTRNKPTQFNQSQEFTPYESNHHFLPLAGLTLTTTLRGQAVPTMLSYQGHVAVNGSDFNGNGNFKFALVDPNGAVSFWSNDGTSAAGSEPANRVVIAVSNGLYSVALGDTALTNMLAIPPAVFTNSCRAVPSGSTTASTVRKSSLQTSASSRWVTP